MNKEKKNNTPKTPRSTDLAIQKAQNEILRAIGPIVGVDDILLQKDLEGKYNTSTQIVEKLIESVSVLALGNDDFNIIKESEIGCLRSHVKICKISH